MTAVAGQLDLLDLLVPLPELDERAAWASRFDRAPWVAPWDCSGGLRKGDSVLGWLCPSCGRLEVNEFVLNINHGYDPSIPGRAPHGPFGESCTRQTLLASQARSAADRTRRAAA